MLETFVESQQPQLVQLAEYCLAKGAHAFTICEDGQRLAIWPAAARDTDCRSSLSAPIQVDSVTVAELCVHGLTSTQDQQQLDIDARMISAIVHLERDLNSMAVELIDAHDQLWALYQLTRTTRNFQNIGQMLNRLAQKSATLVKTECAFIWVKIPEKSAIVEHHPVLLLSNQEIDEYIDEMVVQDLGYLSKNWQNQDTIYFSNMLLVPIVARGVERAVLGFINKKGSMFESPDIKLAKTISEYAGAQIENVLYYQASLEQVKIRSEMELANRVQFQLLPQRVPIVAGIDLWAASTPASQVGGDFYDFHSPAADAPFTFVVGDVSGKGIASALLMAMTRSILRVHIKKNPAPTPAEIIYEANRQLYEDFSHVNMFATVFVGQYVPEDQSLLFVNAGHSPVVYCPDGGNASFIQADTVPLGILPEISAQNQRLQMQSGDLFLVGSDGLYEVHNAQEEMFGHERLMSLVESYQAESAYQITRDIYRTVAEFSNGRSQEDDRTVVILKVHW